MLPDLPTFFIATDRRSDLTPEQKLKLKQEEEKRFATVSEEIHCLAQLLIAYTLYERDKEYVVLEGKVLIVDENTGRLMPGRRWSEGLHQAVEAKEGVVIEKETKTYATITIQNYFRLYEKLAGHDRHRRDRGRRIQRHLPADGDADPDAPDVHPQGP